jgi:hypothetical protein
MRSPVFILSIRGGGIKGIIVLEILRLIEEEITGIDIFDIYAGTSVGAIIISNIVYKKRTIKYILENYTDNVFKSIFTKNNSIGTKVGYRPLYDGTYKTKLLQDTFEDQLINDTDKKVLITLYSVSKQLPLIVKSYEEDYGLLMVRKVVNASSSPPNYFPSQEYDNDGGIGIDGAIFANDSTDYAYADALKIYGPDKDIRILTIGTGTSILKPIGQESMEWGSIQWVTKGSLFDILIDSDQVTVDYKVKHFTKALGHKYLHIDRPVAIALDDVSKIDELRTIGRDLYKEYKEQLVEFFKKD